MNIDGKPSPVAKYDNATNSILIQTDEDSAVGNHQVVLRDCNALERLLELNLYINITDQSQTMNQSLMQAVFDKQLSAEDAIERAARACSSGRGSPSAIARTSGFETCSAWLRTVRRRS